MSCKGYFIEHDVMKSLFKTYKYEALILVAFSYFGYSADYFFRMVVSHHASVAIFGDIRFALSVFKLVAIILAMRSLVLSKKSFLCLIVKTTLALSRFLNGGLLFA